MLVHMAGGDDFHLIKYLLLKLEGSTRHCLSGLPENSIGVWDDLEDEFGANFQGTYARPRDAGEKFLLIQRELCQI